MTISDRPVMIAEETGGVSMSEKNTICTLEITGFTAEGMGVARLEGRVVFVPCTIPGERWRVRLEKVKKNVAWGRGVELLSLPGAGAG